MDLFKQQQKRDFLHTIYLKRVIQDHIKKRNIFIFYILRKERNNTGNAEYSMCIIFYYMTYILT